MFLKSFTFPSPRVALVNLPFLTPPTPMALQSSQAHPGHGVLQLIVALLCFGTFGTGTQTGPCGKLHLADAGASPPPVGSLPHLLWGLVVPPNTRPPVPSTLGASVMPFTLGGPTLPSAQARIHKWSPPVTGAGQGSIWGCHIPTPQVAMALPAPWKGHCLTPPSSLSLWISGELSRGCRRLLQAPMPTGGGKGTCAGSGMEQDL